MIRNKNRKWVTIRIETKSREFLSKMLITHKLLKEGYGVVITNKIGLDTGMFPKGIYVINSLFKNSYKNILDIKKYGHKLILLDEEGLVHLNNERYINRLYKKSLDEVEYVFCFGKDQAQIILDRYPNMKEKVKITGNPRMNLLNKDLRPLIIDNENKKIKSYSNYILIVSNFSYVNFNCSVTDWDEKKSILREMLIFMGVENEMEFEEHYNYIFNIFEAMKKLIVRVHEKYPDYNIIIRPHPSEDSKTWEQFAKKYKNIYVESNGDMNTWLVHAKLVIQNSCTSAIECLLLGVPCISYRPYVNEKHDQPLPNLLSKNVFSEDEAIKQVDGILRDDIKYDYTEFNKLSEYYISNHKANDSVDSIVDIIKNIEIEPVNYTNMNVLLRKIRLPHIKFVIKEGVKKMVGLTPEWIINMFKPNTRERILAVKNDKGADRFGDINAEEVKKTLDKLSLFFKSNMNYNVEQMGNEIVIY